MRHLLLPLTLAAAALAPAATVTTTATAAVAADAPADRACFYEREVRGFTQALNDTAINLRVGAKDVYQLILAGHCDNLNWERAIELSNAGGGPRICEGTGVQVLTSSDRCPVSSIRRLTPEEVAALPPKERP